VGRVADLEARANASERADAPTGIAHTRWATHGGVTEINAHPHASLSVNAEVSVVHNGIIENHEALRSQLRAKGYEFQSQTDTEVIAHLLHSLVTRRHEAVRAVKQAVRQLEGAYAIAVISTREPNTVVGSRKGSPLLLGVGKDGSGRARTSWRPTPRRCCR
jgi:glucosamine--fructose-6-phosphate aminotransferase (isomerizing)